MIVLYLVTVWAAGWLGAIVGISLRVITIYGYATGHEATIRNATYLRGELVNPNATGRDRKVTFNKAAAKRLGEDIRKRNLAKELVGSRIKLECWDSMEVQKKEVGFTKGFAISITVLTLEFIGQWPCRGNQRTSSFFSQDVVNCTIAHAKQVVCQGVILCFLFFLLIHWRGDTRNARHWATTVIMR